MNIFVKFLTLLFLGLFVFSLAKITQSDSNLILPQHIFDEAQENLILKTGLEQVRHAISLRDKLVKNGIDFTKAKHIPEFEAQFPLMAEYFREAAKTRTDKQADLEKILNQIEGEFKKNSMPLHKWNLFHEQLSMLFSDDVSLAKYAPGKLNFKNPSYETHFSKSFPCFVYVHDGILGLQTLNLAFASDIMVLAMPTDKVLKADGIERNAYSFVYHDAAHFSGFRDSPYAYDRFRTQSLELYNKIETQPDTLARVQDHLILFMLIHEFYYTGSYYMDTFEKVLQSSTLSMIRALPYGLDTRLDRNKKFIFNSIRYKDIFESDSIKITALNESEYLVSGKTIEGSKIERSLIATIFKDSDSRRVEFKTFNDEKVTYIDSGSQFADLVPLIEMMEQERAARGSLNPLSEMKKYARTFLVKYADLKV